MHMLRRTIAKNSSSIAQSGKYASPALDKGLDVVELLAKESGGLTKSEISRRLGRTVSEIFRMLLCLERRGYIAQAADERYTLTLKLFQLVQEHPPTERLITEALPVMHRVAHDARQSCLLATLDGAQVIIVAQVNAATSVGFYVKLGSAVDLMEGSSGYVILAFQSEDARQRTVAEWQRRTGKRVPADLVKHLARIRRKGFEQAPSYKVRGVTNISYPIFNEHGSAVCALGIPYIQHNESNLSTGEVAEMLGKAAAEITTAIGGKFRPA
jgi:DNA-binding IclR family transcriptional regulator